MPASLPKNLNIYWLTSTVLSVWFLFVHTPPLLFELAALQDFRFPIHLIGVYCVCLGCILNALIAPSSWGGKARIWHIWVGRVAMLGGLIVFLSGAWMSWYPFGVLPVGFAAFITLLGLLQLFAQTKGYIAIKKYQRLKQETEELRENEASTHDELKNLEELKLQALNDHIFYMIMLFVVGCGFPAALRLAKLFGNAHALIALVTLYLALAVMVNPYSSVLQKKPDTETLNDRRTPNESEEPLTESLL